jgi:hypothetical protein
MREPSLHSNGLPLIVLPNREGFLSVKGASACGNYLRSLRGSRVKVYLMEIQALRLLCIGGGAI